MLFKKTKYRRALKNTWIHGILDKLGLNGSHSSKSEKIYATFKDYKSLERCSRDDAIEFTAKYYRLSHNQMTEILCDFNQE